MGRTEGRLVAQNLWKWKCCGLDLRCSRWMNSCLAQHTYIRLFQSKQTNPALLSFSLLQGIIIFMHDCIHAKYYIKRLMCFWLVFSRAVLMYALPPQVNVQFAMRTPHRDIIWTIILAFVDILMMMPRWPIHSNSYLNWECLYRACPFHAKFPAAHI